MLRLSLLSALLSWTTALESELSTEILTKFHHWVTFHGKFYDSHEEKLRRLQVWLENDGTWLESLLPAVWIYRGTVRWSSGAQNPPFSFLDRIRPGTHTSAFSRTNPGTQQSGPHTLLHAGTQ